VRIATTPLTLERAHHIIDVVNRPGQGCG